MGRFSATYNDFIYRGFVRNRLSNTLFEVTGTVTGAQSTTVLIDENATFITDGVMVGDTVTMDVSGETALVASVDSETQLTTAALSGADTYDPADAYTIDNGDVLRVCIYHGADKRHFIREIAGGSDNATGSIAIYLDNNASVPVYLVPFQQATMFSISPDIAVTEPGVPIIIEVGISSASSRLVS